VYNLKSMTMKKQLITLVFMVLAFGLYGQSTIHSLVQKGIEYHDNQQYSEAIKTYKLALAIDSKSPLANYEIAMTYFYTKAYKRSIKHLNKVLKQKNDYLLDAYNAKAACLDYMGKQNKAIKTYKKALEIFSNSFLLNYNLGFTYYNIENYKEADKCLMNAIALNPNHAKSHLLLGLSKYSQKKRIKSLLSLYYFLFLDAGSKNASQALNIIKKQRATCVSVDPSSNSNSINILPQSDATFATADMLLCLIEASKKRPERNGKRPGRPFAEETRKFFQALGELKKENATGLWWNRYVPFFYKLSQTEHFETFWHYIGACECEKDAAWLNTNEGKFKRFISWASQNRIEKE